MFKVFSNILVDHACIIFPSRIEKAIQVYSRLIIRQGVHESKILLLLSPSTANGHLMFLSQINNRKIEIFEHLNNVKLRSWNFASKIDTELVFGF